MTHTPAEKRLHATESWAAAVAGNLAVRLCGLIGGIFIARALGPTGKGVITSATIWPTVALSVGAVINVQTVTYFTARQGERGLQACLYLAIGFAVALLPASLLLNWLGLGLTHRGSLRAANAYALSVPFSVLAGVFSAALLAEGRVVMYWLMKVIGAALLMVPIVVLALAGHLTVRVYVIAAIAGTAATALLTAFAQRTTRVRLTKPDGALAKSILSFGAKTTFTLVPYQLNLRLDQLLMSAIAPLEVLGAYNVAFAWSSTLSMVGSGFSSVVLARSARIDPERTDDLHAAARTLRRAFIVLFLAGTIAALVSPIAVPLLFGQDFRAGVTPAVILCVAAIPLYANLLLHEFLRGLGYPGLGGMPEMIGLVVSAVGLAVLFPRFGATGAAIASLASYLIVMGTLVTRAVRRIPGFSAVWLVPRLGDLRAIVIAGAAFARRRTRSAFGHAVSR